MVMLTATDASNNSNSTMCEVVIEDNVKPSMTCPADFEIDLIDPNDCFGDIAVSMPITDACTTGAAMAVSVTSMLETSPGVFAASGGVSIAYNATNDDFDITGTNLPAGINVIEVTATDVNGNTETCSFEVTVNDLFGPVINSCPNDITAVAPTGDCEFAVSWTPPAISDPCDAFTFTASHNPGDLFPVGETTTVTYTAMDPSGNMTSCSFDITVDGDCAQDIDLKPQFVPQSGSYIVGVDRDQIFRIRNFGTLPTTGTIQVFVSDIAAFDITYNATQSTADGTFGPTSVNNADWTTTVLASGILYESTVAIPAGGESKIAANYEALVAGQSGNINVTVLTGSGGDNDPSNNSAAKFLNISL